MKLLTTRSLACFLTLVGCLHLSADEGMWLFNQPPREILKSRYGFDVTEEWLDHLQKASVRFNSGGSGSFVSAEGLVLSNHHVAADALQKLSTENRDILADGFYAQTRDEELPCVDLELNVLMSIEDVTGRVNAAVEDGTSAEQAFAARRAVIAAIEKESLDNTGYRSDVITLYQGGAYHLYRFKKYTDVRLVHAPEQQIAFFGGDPDNFEYPRYCLDYTFFRAYENDQPVKVSHFLKWNPNGPEEGELIFVSGHPGRTNRLLTVKQLEYQRDILQPDVLSWLNRMEVLLNTYSSRSTENRRRAKDLLFGIQNSRKAYTGMHAGLLNPAIFAQKRQQETQLRRTVAARADLQAYQDAWDRISEAQEQIVSARRDYNFLEGGRAFYGDLFGIAQTLLRAAVELPKPNGERLREFVASSLDSLKFSLFSEKPIHDDLEWVTLADGLTYLADTFGPEDPLVMAILKGRSPRQTATQLLAGTRVADVAFRKEIFEGGITAVNQANDSMIELARLVDRQAREARKKLDTAVETQRAAHAEISKARFAIEGSSNYPDATFTLRLAFGEVAGYQEGTKQFPYETRFSGLFARAESQGHEAPFNLPERWRKAESILNLESPVNFVSKVDIIGGNSGSPVVNRQGELVGLIFDGNIHSLTWSHGYDDQVARAISVHSRGILESLRAVYQTEDLLQELLNPK